MKEDCQKALTNLTLFFLPNPVPFDGQDNKKQTALQQVTCCSSGYKTSSVNFLY